MGGEWSALELGFRPMSFPVGGVVGHESAGEAGHAQDEHQMAADVAQHDGEGVADSRRLPDDKVADAAANAAVRLHRQHVGLSQRLRRQPRVRKGFGDDRLGGVFGRLSRR